MENLIIEKRSFDDKLKDLNSYYINNYPIVYILYNNNRRPTAYIGQTVHAKRRMHDHLKDYKRSVHENTILIGHERFNQSATYNIETNLINYFIADNLYKLQNVSQTVQNQIHNYYEKDFYNEQVFHEIWDHLLQDGLAKESIETLKNRDIFKLSPYKELSQRQLDIKNKILDFCKERINMDGNHVFLIEGEAGTGKSVLLSSLFNTIQDYTNDVSSNLAGKNNYLLVNHSEMIKTYKSIASSLPNLKKNQFLKPTPFINKMDKTTEKADIVLVDEAHLLLTKNDTYNNFKYDNQLKEIIKRSKIAIIIFDPKQVLKIKSYWNEDLIEEIIRTHNGETFRLESQFRIQASPEVPNWIDNFVDKQLTPIPNDESSSYEIKIFENSKDFRKAIVEKNRQYGLSRIVSTFDYLHKKDGKDYYVDKNGLNMPWNTTSNNTTWAEEPQTINEVGSIYTVQGFDLNYVGVVLGPSVSYDDDKDEIVIDTTKYKDTEAYRSRKDMAVQEIETAKEQIVLNSINILMKRGIKGLYIYPTDPKLKKKLLSLVMNEIEALVQQVNKFRDERDWRKYHNPKDLAISISIEAAELLEDFQWKSNEEALLQNGENIKDEIADILIYTMMLCSDLDLNVNDIILSKLKITPLNILLGIDKIGGSSLVCTGKRSKLFSGTFCLISPFATH